MRRLTRIWSVPVVVLLSGWMTLGWMGCAQPSGQPRADFGKEQQVVCSTPTAFADGTLSASQCEQIDRVVTAVLTGTGAPSASVAVVWDGRIVYEHAYGSARFAPPTPATRAMRYSIGSVSKQFTAAAVLLLAEEGRLSLNDKVGQWLPDLTRAKDVSIRRLLSMTSGYQDYWPQDYLFPAMREPITPQGVLDRWAHKPLDFEPGSKWQYSNTNYIIAGLIVERVSGMRLVDFLQQRIFTPLGMSSVRDIDAGPLGAEDAPGWLRNALGPLRPAPKEAPGWLFAAGQLAMTAHDLALWDISVIEQTLLQPASYRTMQTEVLLASGVASGYGLGVRVATVGGRRQVAHGGAISGYVSANHIYPDQRAAIVVFINMDAGPAARIAQRIAAVLFEQADAAQALDQARRIFADLQKGRIDRALFTPNANAYFSDQVLSDHASSLRPLGAPTEFVQTGQNLRGGMICRGFRIKCKASTLELTTQTLPEGQIEQYLIARAE